VGKSSRHLRNTRKHYRITAARLWSVSCARQIQLVSSHPTPPRSIPLSHQSHGLPNGLFLQVYESLVFIPCVLHSQPMFPQLHFLTYELTPEHEKINFRMEIFGTHAIAMYTWNRAQSWDDTKLETCAWKTAEQRVRGPASGGILRYYFLTLRIFLWRYSPHKA